MTIRTKSVDIPGSAPLVGTLFQPAGRSRAALVLHGATGTPAGFYRAFASWAAEERDLTVLTYDYRGIGASPALPRHPASMGDWGIADQQQARDWLRAQAPRQPLWVLGHSLGGMMLPFQWGLEEIDRVITVAAGAVHWTDHPWPYRAQALAFWFGPGALSARLLGRIPGPVMGLSRDISIPRAAFLQWRRWCTQRGFHASDPDLPAADPSGLRAPVKMVAVADDDLCPPASVWRLMRAYPQAYRTQLTLHPTAGPIGHHGAFRRANAAHWPDLLD
jgi:predicted alpha/beta hydrolase